MFVPSRDCTPQILSTHQSWRVANMYRVLISDLQPIPARPPSFYSLGKAAFGNSQINCASTPSQLNTDAMRYGIGRLFLFLYSDKAVARAGLRLRNDLEAAAVNWLAHALSPRNRPARAGRQSANKFLFAWIPDDFVVEVPLSVPAFLNPRSPSHCLLFRGVYVHVNILAFASEL